MFRTIFALAGLLLVVISTLLTSGGKLRTKKPSARTFQPRVLMVGDSLTVGAFGGALRDFLVARCGASNVAVYGSCGSSPEDWLRGEPEFVTKCGYREQTPRKDILFDFKNGRAPKRVATPKLENLVLTQRPNIVIVQLGTNWMDALVGGIDGKESQYSSVLDRFIAAIRSRPGVRRIVWITPPDSSHFSDRTHRIVERLIRSAARRDRFETIISRRLTRYIPGKTGGDGVHYNSEAGTDWAKRVARELSGKLR